MNKKQYNKSRWYRNDNFLFYFESESTFLKAGYELWIKEQ